MNQFSPRPRVLHLDRFQLFQNIRTTVVNNTGGKIAAGINDTAGKFATGISDSGGKFLHHFR
jgi:hypothetical protein